MTTQPGVIVYFAELEVGARFRPLLLGAELSTMIYTKIEPRMDNNLEINAESEGMIAHIPATTRVLPIGV